MKLLAIDSATAACSVALLVDGAIQQRFAIAPQQHLDQLLPMAETLLADAGLSWASLNALAFGCGPGSFTGLRIAASIIQGLALASDLPVLPVSDLQALAQGAYRRNPAIDKCLVAWDARKAEVYWGQFNLQNVEHSGGKLMQLLDAELVSQPAHLPSISDDAWCAVGNGWQEYASALEARFASRIKWRDIDSYPEAYDIVTLAAYQYHLGLAVSAESAWPIYLRDNVVG
ncbi:MAG: tRNA (adenosine(37)-N6)-threonylcarbamoyltransferase complex dimerization subunit type 1 TsaB [Gammaproteobacteria bacterium]